MKRNGKIFPFFALLLALTLTGCSGKSTVTETQPEEILEVAPSENVLVMVVTRKITYRNLFEGEMVNRLDMEGTGAVGSYEILPYTNILTRDAVAGAVRRYGIDSILIISLDDSGTDNESFDRTDLYAYYNNLYEKQQEASEKSKGFYSLRASLYDTGSEKLTWSMSSEDQYTYKTKSLDKAASQVIKGLRNAGII